MAAYQRKGTCTDEYTRASAGLGTHHCPGFPEEISRARRWLSDLLSDMPCLHQAALIVTELATNAVTHTASGHGVFHIAVARSDVVILIAVTDEGSTQTTPHVERAGDDDTHGRGLRLVTALASNVYITGDKRGHTVTAELLLRQGNRAAARQALNQTGAA